MIMIIFVFVYPHRILNTQHTLGILFVLWKNDVEIQKEEYHHTVYVADRILLLLSKHVPEKALNFIKNVNHQQ